MTDVWSERAELYRQSAVHRAGPDLELVAEWAEGATALDVASGGGHTARRLRDEGFDVVTLDPAPGMRADVVARAEDIPFADDSFDVVACRIAPHHFDDIRAAMREMARVSRDLVLVVDNAFVSEDFEAAEKLRDPTHVRSYSADEWRALFEQAGLSVEELQTFDVREELGPWLERAGCTDEEAARVRELLGDRADGTHLTLTRIVIKGRKRR